MGGSASHLLGRCSGVRGRGRAFFHAVFETFDSATEVRTDAFEFFGAKHQYNNQ